MTTARTVVFLLPLVVGCTPTVEPPPPSVERARILSERGFDEDAVEALDAAVRSSPADAELLFERGLLKERVDDAEGAEADYTAAIELRSDFAAALINRASIRAREGRFDAAAVDLGAAIDADPGDPLAYANRAQVFIDLGRGSKAEADLTLAERFDPGRALTSLRLGDALRLQGREDEAATARREAARRGEGDADILLRTSRSMTGLGLFADAALAADRAVEADPAAAGAAVVRDARVAATVDAAARRRGWRLTPRPEGRPTSLQVETPAGTASLFLTERTPNGPVVSAADLAAARGTPGSYLAVLGENEVDFLAASELNNERLRAVAFQILEAAETPPPTEAAADAAVGPDESGP